MKNRVPRAWVATCLSVVLHMALLWQYTLPFAENPAPIGHWVEMIPSGRPEFHAPTTATPKTIDSPVNAPVESKPSVAAAAPTPPAAVLGNTTQSTGLSGPIGDMNGVKVSIRERYLYELEAYLNQLKSYPPRARHLQQTGRVEIAFHVHGDGTISDPHVVRPCIHDLLNQSALALVSSVRQFRPLPPELKLSVLHVTVPIQYELN